MMSAFPSPTLTVGASPYCMAGVNSERGSRLDRTRTALMSSAKCRCPVSFCQRSACYEDGFALFVYIMGNVCRNYLLDYFYL
jgi:hypothetical protein